MTRLAPLSGQDDLEADAVPGEAGTDWQPWTFAATATPGERAQQHELQRVLRARHSGWMFGDGVFVSRLAALAGESIELGDRSYVAANVHLTGRVRAGADCSFNVGCAVRGTVSLGDGVRIGTNAAVLGFNHSFSDPEVPVFRQPLDARGITIGDDVWIGANVVVVDGVTVGSRSVLAAGAVVVKDVPAGAVVGGNPARVLRWRVDPPQRASDELEVVLAQFGRTARSQGEEILARYWSAEAGPGGRFVDTPGARPTLRAQCDAVEVADLLLGGPPPQLPPAVYASRILEQQDPGTGLFVQLSDGGFPMRVPTLEDDDALYHVISAGAALTLLGFTPEHPVHAVDALDADALVALLDGLPWEGAAWHAGSVVDALATALHQNRSFGRGRHHGAAPALFGWLLEHADPATGMWGRMRRGETALEVVNGFYRAARGTFGQWGVPLPYPSAVIDAVLEHVRTPSVFGPGRQDACAVLDVAWPLRVAGRQTDHRREEVRSVATRFLLEILPRWQDGEGFAFRAAPDGRHPDGPLGRGAPGLQGTEMWLAVVWELAALLGVEDALGYRPRGVHIPDPR